MKKYLTILFVTTMLLLNSCGHKFSRNDIVSIHTREDNTLSIECSCRVMFYTKKDGVQIHCLDNNIYLVQEELLSKCDKKFKAEDWFNLN